MTITNRSWEKRKCFSLTVIVLVFAVVISFFSTQLVFAADDDTIDTDSIAAVSASDLLSLVDNVFGYYEAEQGDNSHGSGSSTESTFANFTRLNEIFDNDLVSSITEIAASLALFMLLFTILLKAIQEFGRGDPTLESALKIFLVLIVGIALISYCDLFLTAFDYAGKWLVGELREVATSKVAFSGDIFDGLKWWVKIVCVILLWLAKFMIVIPCWQIFYEMVLRRAFMPLAMVDLISDGSHGPGARYMKNYLGVYLRIGICYISVALMIVLLDSCDFLEKGAQTSLSFTNFLALIGILMGGVTLMTKSQSLVREILGA